MPMRQLSHRNSFGSVPDKRNSLRLRRLWSSRFTSRKKPAKLKILGLSPPQIIVLLACFGFTNELFAIQLHCMPSLLPSLTIFVHAPTTPGGLAYAKTFWNLNKFSVSTWPYSTRVFSPFWMQTGLLHLSFLPYYMRFHLLATTEILVKVSKLSI